MRPKKKDRKTTLNTNNTRKQIGSADTEDRTIDTSVEHIKELEDELLILRIENVFLKEQRSDRDNPNAELEAKILAIRVEDKDYGYRRVQAELRNQGYIVNKKKAQRIMQKLKPQVMSCIRKSRKYSSYKG